MLVKYFHGVFRTAIGANRANGRMNGRRSRETKKSVDAASRRKKKYLPVVGYEANVEGKKNEKLLVLLPNTVVDPGTVVIHLTDTPKH